MGGAIRVQLLGRFEVEVDGRVVDASAFERKKAAALVKPLALSPGRRLHREQVIDALWPDQAIDEAAPHLHKMASYARKALGDKSAIELRDEAVMLWPDREVRIDVAEFELADPQTAADLYGGELARRSTPSLGRVQLRESEVVI